MVVIMPVSIPNASWRTIATGAKQLVYRYQLRLSGPPFLRRSTHGTTSITKDVVTSGVRLVIDSVDDIGHILTRSRDQDLLGTPMCNVHTGRFPRCHLARGLHDERHTC